MGALGHPDRCQGPLCALAAGVAVDAGIGQRQLDVRQRARAGHQVEALEDEPDLAVAQVGEVVFVHVADVDAVDQVAPAAGQVQAAEDVHQRALAAPGAAHDGHEVPARDLQRHVAQGPHLGGGRARRSWRRHAARSPVAGACRHSRGAAPRSISGRSRTGRGRGARRGPGTVINRRAVRPRSRRR